MKKHIFYFDALRALAIISVIVLHATAMLKFSMPSNMTHVFRFDVIVKRYVIIHLELELTCF